MNTTAEFKTLVATLTPEADIEKIAYPGQPKSMRQYKTGYEAHFNRLPVIGNDNMTEEKLAITQKVMAQLSADVSKDPILMAEDTRPGRFSRTIIGMQEPCTTMITLEDGSVVPEYTERAEIVIAKWGDGHTSPVHGHSTGYMHEELLSGKMRVNTYRITDLEAKVVRPVETVIVEPGVFVSGYAQHNPDHMHKRQTLIHNFTSVGHSISMHYLPEHTRDGRDNVFTVDHFSNSWTIMSNDVERIDSRQGMYLQPGDVVLVRSTNVPEYADHFLVVTGPPVMKEHGFRIQERAIMASPMDSALLDEYEMQTGLILLKLKDGARNAFLDFHDIRIAGKEVIFPEV